MQRGESRFFLPSRKAAGNTSLLFYIPDKKERATWLPVFTNTSDLVKRRSAPILVDLVDIELFSGWEGVEELVAKDYFSNMISLRLSSEMRFFPLLKQMEEAGADIAKHRCYANMHRRCTYSSFCHLQKKRTSVLVITMFMAKADRSGRLSGEVFGSCLTFGAAGNVPPHWAD